MKDEPLYSIAEVELELAKSMNRRVWALLEKEARSPNEDLEMLLAAHGSLYHWKKVGTAVHDQRGCWMISRVFRSLGKAQDALDWALRCQQISQENPGEMMDFDLAYSQEALARAYALSGKLDQAREHWQQAAQLGARISDPEDKKIFLEDFRGGEWYQLQIE